jgi:4,5-DOPA dioxygenase extradiol
VLVIGSGNIVHNLGRIDWSKPDVGFAWSQRFDEAARELLTSDASRVPSLVSHADFDAAVPTPDHFLPVLYLAGLAAAAGKPAEVLVDGYAMGSLSMTAYTLDLHVPDAAGAGAAPTLPPPDVVPPEDTNT